MKKLNFIFILIVLVASCQKVNNEKEFIGQWLKVDHIINGQALPAFMINTNYILTFKDDGVYSVNNQILPWHGYPSSTNSDIGTWLYDSKNDQITFTTDKNDTVNPSNPLSKVLVTIIESEKENTFSMFFTDQGGQSVTMVFEKLQ
jgi:hypothetical protein